jgi:predicted acyl esterase
MRKLLLAVALITTLLPLAGRAEAPPPSPMIYVPVDDGTEIALRVFYPDGYVEGNRYPALVQMEGYGGASAPNDSSFVGKNYVVVAISVRGTGCSAGTFDLFSERSSKDGAWIIDNWIPKQSWSNDKVGIYGHSYGGLTGFLVAAEVPDTTHLKAVAVSGLIDDFYRGILYPGGVLNYGFPLLWGAGLRPISEHASNLPFITSDQHCLTNYLSHQTTDLVPQPTLFLDTYGSPFATPDSFAIRNALMTHIDGIKAPIQLGQQYQDEQTGPRGGHVLWENIPAGLPKRMTISTGMHNPNDPTGNKRDWLDCWIINGGASGTSSLGNSCADVLDPAKRVLLYFESMGSDRLAPYVSSDWPLPETDWRRYFLRADGTLKQIGGNDDPVTYLSTGTGRHMTENLGHAVGGLPYDLLAPYGFTTGLPDTARYTLQFNEDTALAGPLELTLFATAYSADVDFWAEILDHDTKTGGTTFVQRGLQRASYRKLDVAKSQTTPGGDIYRPFHPYLEIEPITPGAVYQYEIEIFPLGHYWRAGHQLVLQLHAPPANDPISTYAYEPNSPSVVQILQDPDHPTSILLPFMPTLPPHRPTAPECGSVVGEVCVTPALG